jgi:hypothetical protein
MMFSSKQSVPAGIPLGGGQASKNEVAELVPRTEPRTSSLNAPTDQLDSSTVLEDQTL